MTTDCAHETHRVGTTRQRGESDFHKLLDKLPAAAYTCDASGLITYFNHHAVHLWGREPKLHDPVDRFCGSFKLFSTTGTPITHDRCWMALALREGTEHNGCEIIVERPDGSRLTVLAHANPYRDETGLVCGAVNVLVDITERKKIEQSFRESDRRKSEFLAVLAHELRNPLAPLRNGMQIIRMSGGEQETLDRALPMMERQLAHLIRLVDDLLDLSRITNSKIELRKDRINLVQAIQDAVDASRPLIEERDHQFSISLPAVPLWIDADRTRIAQVFANLLNNSARYTSRGGQVRLTVERQGSDAVATVTDNGAGIPSDVLPNIFEMFTQADRSLERTQGGLGIGLSLVKGLVELHGGSVSAHSDGPGKGSEFVVRLPLLLSCSQNAERPGEPEAGIGDSPHYKVLVVDDNEDGAESLAVLMELMGHETRTASDGLAAVEAAESFRPDVILLDIGLPKLNGYDACRRIRQQPWGERMVLIAQTGWGQEDDRARSKEAGFNFHLVKPVDPKTLGKLLAGLLLTPA